MASPLPENVYLYTCTVGGTEAAPAPSGCAYVQVKSSVLYPDGQWLSQEQVDGIVGGVIGLVATIIVFALLKKAIES
ncbi:hypothetical protein GXB78_27605 [Pseudomonas moraviensis subsp. stanleyae]|uniref:hypothetical protein n=1 Tax=Pseudomonas moraviensis TaxID=321662 RepID=UPI002E33E8C2|nr:hypothetical protein [Pseudomonas moraviensis]MED7670974.1 hypothetical protein [Pseudomonas moraviensis subsp. stanleyae]